MKHKYLILCFFVTGCLTTVAEPLPTPEDRARLEAQKLCVKPINTSDDPEIALQEINDSIAKQQECVNEMYVKLLPSYMQQENNRLQAEQNRIQQQGFNAMRCASASTPFERGMYCRK